MHTARVWLAALLAFLLTGPPAQGREAIGFIDEIRFVGNKVTQERILRQEMVVREGDRADMTKVEQSRQALMNLGLFKTVTSEFITEDTLNVLIITLEERFYILPLPLLDVRLEEEEYSYGMELRHDNLMGLNQRLKLTYENKKSVDSEVPLRKEAGFGYTYPRVVGTANSLGVSGKMIREEVDETLNGVITGSYKLDSRNLGFNVSRWLKRVGSSDGWRVGGGMGVGQKIYSRQSGTAWDYDDSQTLEVRFGLDYLDIEEHPYNRSGAAYGYNLALALPGIGSDYSYNRHLFYLRNYHAMTAVDANLNTQLRIGMANGSSFGNPAYSLGGSRSLRGYENDVVRGNAMFQLNAEYHHHLTGYRQLRGVLFVDVGNTWPGVLEADFGKLLPSTGLGMRWRVQSFVDVTLRADYGYAIDTQESKLYLSTSGSF